MAAGDPKRIELSVDPEDYISGPREGEAARTEGGTTTDGAVAVFGASREQTRSGSRRGTPSRARGGSRSGSGNSGS